MSRIIPRGAEIERARILSGMTCQELAKQASILKSSVTRAEQGQGVTVTTATGICKALGKSFDDLFVIDRREPDNMPRREVI